MAGCATTPLQPSGSPQHAVEAAYDALSEERFGRFTDVKHLKRYSQRALALDAALSVRQRARYCAEGRQWACAAPRPASTQQIQANQPPSAGQVPVASTVAADPAGTVPQPKGDVRTLDRVETVGSTIKAHDLITNNQESGVDEGDIVKKSGRFVFVLRRGWLHVVDTGSPAAPDLALVQSLQVATDATGETVWYDEILAQGDRLLLLGYNYQTETVELIAYAIGEHGELERLARYWIRVQDYFSASNYGARIERDNLLLILAMPLDTADERAWPAWSRRDAGSGAWQPLVEVDDIHLPAVVPLRPVIHLVVQCPLQQFDGEALGCRARGVVGEDDATSYVSPGAVYLAVEHLGRDTIADPRFDGGWPDPARWRPSTVIYRFPLASGAAPAHALFEGVPGTQFTFSERAGRLHVAMTDPAGDPDKKRVLLLQSLEVTAFDGAPEAAVGARLDVRRELDRAQLVYRFTDLGLLIGASSRALAEEEPGKWLAAQGRFSPSRIRRIPPLLLQPLDGGAAMEIPLGHAGDQIEPMATAAIVSGVDLSGDWRLSVLSARHGHPDVVSLAVPDHLPSEERSHAFNQASWPDGSTLLGWPVVGREAAAHDSYLSDEPSDLAFFRWGGGRLSLAGVLDMRAGRAPMTCRSDCHDWYGNARLFFFDSRIFALSGPRLVEAAWDGVHLAAQRSVELP
ncbi:MAG: beta-propeller domain-containing protein [Xanthomonadales bacterium]|nr:beta-propeller domain-containing protein [Xanthomonadales bacterium]